MAAASAGRPDRGRHSRPLPFGAETLERGVIEYVAAPVGQDSAEGERFGVKRVVVLMRLLA